MTGAECAYEDHAECPECGDCIDVSRHTMAKIPKTDPDGFPIITPDGEIVEIEVPRYSHVVMHSRFNSTGIVAAACVHGIPPQEWLPNIPNPDSTDQRAYSFMRSKYIDSSARCPECRGEARPADLTVPRAA